MSFPHSMRRVGALALVLVAAAWGGPPLPAPEPRPAFFSDAYLASIQLRQPAPLAVQYRRIGGVEVPFINGDKGLWGVRVANGAGKPLAQAEYEASWLRMQGVNFVRTTDWRGPQGELGMRQAKTAPNVPLRHWFAYFDLLEKYGLSFVIDNPAVRCRDFAGFLPEELYAGQEDRITREDGTRGYFGGCGATGNIYDPAFVGLVAMKEKLVARDLLANRGHVGTQVSNEPQAGASYGPEGQRSWHAFLQRLFQDAGPGVDTNGDGLTFNRAYQARHESWQQVAVFKAAEMASAHAALAQLKRRLFDYWTGTVWADYQQRVAAAAVAVRPELYVAMSSNGYIGGGQDLSTIVSLPAVRGLYRNIYNDPTFVFYAAAVAHSVGKPLLISEANVRYSDPAQIYPFIAASLPHASAYTWFVLSYQDDSANNDWGRWCNIVDWWVPGNWLDKTYPQWRETPVRLQQPAGFDKRWEAFVKFAPFVSRFFAAPLEQQSGILWLVGSHPDTYPSTRGLIFQSHAVTDQALLINPEAVDLHKYPVVILFTPAGAGLYGRELHARLDAYVRAGGILVACPGSFREDTDLRGRPCRDYWGAELATVKTGTTLLQLGRQFMDDLEPYIVSRRNVKTNRPGILLDTPGKPGEVVYKLPLPAGSRTLLVTSNQVPWDDAGEIELLHSADGRQWRTLCAGSAAFTPMVGRQALDVSANAGGDYYLKYRIQRRADAPDYAGDQWFWLAPFGRFTTHVHGLTVEVVDTALASGQYACTLGEAGYAGWGGGRYFTAKREDGWRGYGTVTTPAGAVLPLVYEKSCGKGKFVLLNQPDFFSFFQHGAPLDATAWERKFATLDAVVGAASGRRLPNYRGLHVYPGKNAVLANYYAEDHFFAPLTQIARTHPLQAGRKTTLDITAPAEAARMVVFDAFALELVGGAYLQAVAGTLRFPAEFAFPWSFHIWVTKPYGKPVLLYADGTLRRAADISDGQWDAAAHTLRFDLVDRAFVSAPERPDRVEVGGRPAAFDYAPASRLLTLRGNGTLALASVHFAQPATGTP